MSLASRIVPPGTREVLVACALLAAPGHGLAQSPEPSAGRATYLDLVQAGRSIAVRDGTTIRIDPAPFELVFPLMHYDEAGKHFHAARIAGSTDPHVLRIATGVGVDDQAEGLEFFAPGTGMAPFESGFYDAFILRPEAHHYVTFHPDEPSHQRARFRRALGPEESEVGFAIESFAQGETIGTISESGIRTLYLVVFLDRDLDAVVDPGEIFRFTLQM